MAAIYRNYGDFTTPTPVAAGSRALPNWGSTFAADFGRLASQPRMTAAVMEQFFNQFGWVQSGIITPDARINGTNGGPTVELPMIRPFFATKEYPESNATWGASTKGHLTVQKLNADSAFVPIMTNAFAVGTDDLTKWMSGYDPLAIAQQYIGANIAQMTTETLRSLLAGLFGTSGPLVSKSITAARASGSVTEANFLTAVNLTRARALNGERGGEMRIAAMHSHVAYYLQQIGMLTFSTSALSTGGAIAWGGGGVGITNETVNDMAGFRVVIDDLLAPTIDAVNGDKYPVYLFEPGVVAMGTRTGLRIRYAENYLSFQNVLVADWSNAMGILGMSWTGSPVHPKDSDFAVPTNWTSKVTDLRNVNIARLIVNTPFAVNP